MLDIDKMKELWISKAGDVASEIASWDSVVSDYLPGEKNNFSEDPFLKFMNEKVCLCQDIISMKL